MKTSCQVQSVLLAILWMCTVVRAADNDEVQPILSTAFPAADSSQMEFTPDGRYLVAISNDKLVRIWDVTEVEQSGKIPDPKTLYLFGYHGISGNVLSACLSPNGDVLAIETNAGRCYLVDWKREQLLATLSIEDVFQTIAWSPDGRFLATGHNLSVTFWELREFHALYRQGKFPLSPEEAARFTRLMANRSQNVRAHEGGVNSLSFSPMSPDYAVSASYDNQPVLWKWNQVEWTQRTKLTGVRDITVRSLFCPDGRILTSGFDGWIRIWAGDGSSHQVFAFDKGNELGSTVYPPTIRLLKDHSVVAAGWPVHSDCTVLRLSDGARLASFRLHTNSVTAAAVNPKRDMVATSGGNSDELFLWDPRDGRLIARGASPGRKRYSVAFSSDGKRLAFGHEHRNPATLQPEERARYDKVWDQDSFDFSWGLLRSQQAALRPLQESFDLESLEPGPAIDSSDQTERWHQAQLRLTDWEVDKFVSKQRFLEGDHSLVILKDHREVHRIVMSDDTNRINAASLVQLKDSGRLCVVVGSRMFLELYDLNSRKLLRCFHGHTGEVQGVAVSPDQTLMASAGSDQTSRLWSLADVQEKPDRVVRPLLTLFCTANRQYVAWSSSGFYTSSPGADEFFGWKINRGIDQLAEFYSARTLQSALYRPDVVKRIVASQGAADGLPQLPTIDQLLAAATPPTVHFISPIEGQTLNESETDLKVTITHPANDGVQAIEVSVNGLSPRALTVVPRDESRMFQQRVQLRRGQNSIGVRAVMGGGIVSDPRTVNVTCNATEALPSDSAGRLLVLAFGVAEYSAENISNLKYSAKNAVDFSAALEELQGKPFSSVQIRAVTDDKATRQGVMDGLMWPRQQNAGAEDFTMVFMSGHGALDKLGAYCFLTSDAVPEKLSETAVRYEDIRQSLKGLAGHRFLLLDTCHAGAAYGGDESNTFSETRLAYDDVLRNAANDFSSGIVTIASCLPHEVSLEDDAWGNGAFTKALVKAVSGRADLNANGEITVSEMETFISGGSRYSPAVTRARVFSKRILSPAI